MACEHVGSGLSVCQKAHYFKLGRTCVVRSSDNIKQL